MLVIGIRKGDRARHLSDAPDTALDALTRSFLGVGTCAATAKKTDRTVPALLFLPRQMPLPQIPHLFLSPGVISHACNRKSN